LGAAPNPTERANQKELVLSRLSVAERETISNASREFSASGGRDSEKLADFFDQIDLNIAIDLCDQEIPTDPITCFRILAIEYPENGSQICNQLKIGHCSYYPISSQCVENLVELKSDCTRLIPIVR
ncbi:MAG: hypothetical protein Q7R47_03165, partial [Candidatus Diapherotrites archaeon]|nr:hypothetical protein [Candidatus Diapherotrites archaeon]